MENNFTSETQSHQRLEMFPGEEPEAPDDGLSADERTQLRELCVLIVISEFLETNEKTRYGNCDLEDPPVECKTKI
jgi:hypothetical protein